MHVAKIFQTVLHDSKLLRTEDVFVFNSKHTITAISSLTAKKD